MTSPNKRVWHGSPRGEDVAAAVGTCPPAGGGVHLFLFGAACRLHKLGLPPDSIQRELAIAVSGCGRPVADREISDAVRNSAGVWQAGVRRAGHVANRARSTKISVNDGLRRRVIAATPMTRADLRDSSPVRLDDGQLDSKWFVDQLYEPDRLLCVGTSNRCFVTAPCGELREVLSSKALIVPSPMTSLWGLTKDGRRSMHTLSNTGPRHYLVAEFDSGTDDDQAALLRHLADMAPLTMVVWSGRRSCHGWFSCAGSSEGQREGFFRYARSLGADPHTWSRCQFVRMPQGWRYDKGMRQEVLYFNPDNIWKGPKHE